MKRPFDVYLVAFWFFLGIISLTWSSMSRALLPKLIEDQTTVQLINVSVFVFLIYVIAGIIQVKFPQRIISITIFSIVSLYQAFAIITFLLVPEIEKKHIIIIFYKAFIVIPSVACVVYLLRQKFREYAKEYLGWKKQDAMHKYVQKQAMKNIGK